MPQAGYAPLIIRPSDLHTVGRYTEDSMHDLTCLIQGCQAKVYAPAGTRSVCREHFLSYLTWRRRKGPQMFMKYAGMTMEEIAEATDTPLRTVYREWEAARVWLYRELSGNQSNDP